MIQKTLLASSPKPLSIFREIRERLKHNFFSSFNTICFVLFLTLNVSITASASSNDISSVITLLLLDEEPAIPEPDGKRVDVSLDVQDEQTYIASNNSPVFAAFELQEHDVELCFDLSLISLGDIFVELNGNLLSASEGKDNCYSIPLGIQRSINYFVIKVAGSGAALSIDRLELALANQYKNELPILTRGGWDEFAVRKVLKIFAFGGHARDSQIKEWADMDPYQAIQEMLNFSEHNLKLSPLAEGEKYTDSAFSHGTLTEWMNFVSDDASNLPIPADKRWRHSNLAKAYYRMTTVRGLNPFRQRIGFWETNYHLATNLMAIGLYNYKKMARYYDIIMEAHEAGLPYHEVMGLAAKSSAIASQYDHRNNRWVFDRDLDEFTCRCNEDFAREIHQLFYGIFGEHDPNHETITIPETAKLLTDMPTYIVNDEDDEDDYLIVDFGTKYHHVNDVQVLGYSISGADASEKIDNLMPISILHPESLKNLPVMIISVLADDNLSEHSKELLRKSWASLGNNKNFLEFIQTYAISKLLHSPSHVKYFTSIERALYQANKYNLDNLEAYIGNDRRLGVTIFVPSPGWPVELLIDADNSGEVFQPLHNVFGGQTGVEASDSAFIFENNHNKLTKDEQKIRNNQLCENCDLGEPWEKKWASILPKRADGRYYVEDVAPWLWKHVVGNMNNYTELERAHLYSLLGSSIVYLDNEQDGEYPLDLNLLMCVIADYQVQENTIHVPIIDVLTLGLNISNYRDFKYCRKGDSGGSYEAHELAALNAQFGREDILGDLTLQNVLNQLGQVQLRIDDDDINVRKNTFEVLSSALGFIFTTPYIFAESK